MEAGRVRGILPWDDLVPCVMQNGARSHTVAGAAQFQGRELPVIDLAARLGLPRTPAGRSPRIVVVEGQAGHGRGLAAFVADSVSKVIDVRARDYRDGMLRAGGRPRRILDPDAVLFAEALSRQV